MARGGSLRAAAVVTVVSDTGAGHARATLNKFDAEQVSGKNKHKQQELSFRKHRRLEKPPYMLTRGRTGTTRELWQKNVSDVESLHTCIQSTRGSWIGAILLLP